MWPLTLPSLPAKEPTTHSCRMPPTLPLDAGHRASGTLGPALGVDGEERPHPEVKHEPEQGGYTGRPARGAVAPLLGFSPRESTARPPADRRAAAWLPCSPRESAVSPPTPSTWPRGEVTNRSASAASSSPLNALPRPPDPSAASSPLQQPSMPRLLVLTFSFLLVRISKTLHVVEFLVRLGAYAVSKFFAGVGDLTHRLQIVYLLLIYLIQYRFLCSEYMDVQSQLKVKFWQYNCTSTHLIISTKNNTCRPVLTPI